MAVVAPLYSVSNNFRRISDSQRTDIIQRCVYLFGDTTYRSVDLSYVSDNGSLREMTDTRDEAGAEASNSTRFSNNSPASTTDASASTVYDRIDLTTSAPIITGLNYPAYYNASGNIQIMSYDDVIDTFINGAVDLLVDGNDRDGTFRIHTANTLADHTIVDENPIFVDQQFDVTFHGLSAGAEQTLELLPVGSLDNPADYQNYYLFRTDQETSYGAPTVQYPVYWNGTGLRRYTAAEWDEFLGKILGYAVINTTGQRISYEVEGVGTDAYTIPSSISKATRGSAMVDTTLDGQARVNDQDGDTYRSQNFPAGSPETETTYTLKIYRY